MHLFRIRSTRMILFLISFDIMLKVSRLKTFFYNSVFQKINASLLYHIRYVSIHRIVKHIPFSFEITSK